MFSLLYYPAILAHEGFLVKGYFQKFAASRRGQCVTNLVCSRYTSGYSSVRYRVLNRNLSGSCDFDTSPLPPPHL